MEVEKQPYPGSGQVQSEPRYTVNESAAGPTSVSAPQAGLRTSLVIPAKNEAANIGHVLRSVPDSVDEVILVDADAGDGTAEAARRERPDLLVVSQHKPGKGAALRDGFAAATGDIVVMIDADGSMDPGEIDKYVEPLKSERCDLVKGSRRMPGGGSTDITAFRSLGNRFLLSLVNGLFGSRFTELCYGYMAFKRPCLDKLQLTADGFEIETQIVVNAVSAGLKVEEVPSMEKERLSGSSNLKPIRDGLRVLATVAGAALTRSPEQEKKPRTRYQRRPARSLAAWVLHILSDV